MGIHLMTTTTKRIFVGWAQLNRLTYHGVSLTAGASIVKDGSARNISLLVLGMNPLVLHKTGFPDLNARGGPMVTVLGVPAHVMCHRVWDHGDRGLRHQAVTMHGTDTETWWEWD